MPEPTRNLCAQIPVTLHDRVREEQLLSGKTLSGYMPWLITTFYDQKGKNPMERENVRTLAIQLDAELFDRLDAYIKRYKLRKKAFLTDLIRQVLDQAEANTTAENDMTPEARTAVDAALRTESVTEGEAEPPEEVETGAEPEPPAGVEPESDPEPIDDDAPDTTNE